MEIPARVISMGDLTDFKERLRRKLPPLPLCDLS